MGLSQKCAKANYKRDHFFVDTVTKFTASV